MHIIKSILRKFKKFTQKILPYKSEIGGRVKLDAQYKEGMWDYLADIEELSRFSVIVGYCQYYHNNPEILEIGCGEGLLKERLCPNKFKSYTGIDISEEAIKRAMKIKDEKSEFIAIDAMHYSTEDKFDIIILNECLIYIEDIPALINMYSLLLRDKGIFIVSIFSDNYHSPIIWRKIEHLLIYKTGSKLDNYKHLQWDIKVFKSKDNFNLN